MQDGSLEPCSRQTFELRPPPFQLPALGPRSVSGGWQISNQHKILAEQGAKNSILPGTERHSVLSIGILAVLPYLVCTLLLVLLLVAFPQLTAIFR